MSLTTDPVVRHFEQEVAAWNCDGAIVFIGAADSALRYSLTKCHPALRTLSISDMGAGRMNPAASKQRQLLLIEDAGLDPVDLCQTLAMLRDTVCGRLVLWSGTLRFSDALALGFRRLDRNQCLFVFDLFEYKQVPDWLNSDHFAHPDRWGLSVD